MRSAARFFDHKQQQRSKYMRSNMHRLQRLTSLAFVLVLASAAQVFGQDSPGTRTVGSGERVKKFKGIVVKREADYFTMSDTMGGPVTIVLMTSSTEVK